MQARPQRLIRSEGIQIGPPTEGHAGRIPLRAPDGTPAESCRPEATTLRWTPVLPARIGGPPFASTQRIVDRVVPLPPPRPDAGKATEV